MQAEPTLQSAVEEMDFAAMLEASFAKEPERGDIITGTILAVDYHGLIVDVNLKRDGIVPRRDLERVGIDPSSYQVGSEVDVIVVRMEDQDDNMILSVSQAQQSEDWKRAEQMMLSEEVWEGIVADANKGGLIVPFGNLRGFVPASHVVDLPRNIAEDDRKGYMTTLLGKKVAVKVIEVNRKRRRLVFSQRDAQRGRREARKELLLDELKEGEVRKGVVSGLRDFGAFVDLGGADGLIHISELAWHRVKHPKEVLNVGDEVDVYILRLDNEGKRIGLSLKRLQKNPWAQAEEMYHVGQLIEGVVSRVAQFGAFVSLEPGIEALLHASQLSDPPPVDPTLIVHEGQKLMLRVISIEPDRQRLGLSLKDVTSEERERWQGRSEAAAVDETTAEADETAPVAQDEGSVDAEAAVQ
ncbi:MAG: S1 RNA-binding domain-containing protein [Anaerolineae bacterium]|nr:S1 RNA-binding domain-containing protein [Anaerolineae bacterium]